MLNENSQTELLDLCKNCDKYQENIAKLVTDIRININHQDVRGNTALMTTIIHSISDSNIEIVKMLIDAGANVNLQNVNGYTALMYAVDRTAECNDTTRNIKIVKILINLGADIHLKNWIGNNCLMIASKYYDENSIEIVKMLIDAGADINAKNNIGRTALWISTCVHKTKLLIDHNGDVNIKYDNNQTMLTILINEPVIQPEIIMKLIHLSKKTLLDMDDYGKTSYEYYIHQKHNFLDDYHLGLLKGVFVLNNTKSARY